MPTLSEQCTREKQQTESAQANDQGCCKNAGQGVPPGKAAAAEIFVLESCSLCIEIC